MGGPYKFLSELGPCAPGAGAFFYKKFTCQKTCEFFEPFFFSAYPAVS